MTGRTHQIRVHLAHAGHPVLGDDKYGDFELNRALARQGVKRLFLHAHRLAFKHPVDGKMMTFESPLPGGHGSLPAGEFCQGHRMKPGRRYSLIVFDWDGTLYDSADRDHRLHPAGGARHGAAGA